MDGLAAPTDSSAGGSGVCVWGGGEVGLRMRPKGRHFRRRNLLPGPGQTQK